MMQGIADKKKKVWLQRYAPWETKYLLVCNLDRKLRQAGTEWIYTAAATSTKRQWWRVEIIGSR